jgi:hypothetical protein
MTLQELIDGLTALGFTDGYAAGGDPAEIILWENEAKKPTNAAIAKAAPQGAYLRELAFVNSQRLSAYQNESDPIFFEFQRGENTEAAWKDKIAEIQARFPFPSAPEEK